MVTNAVTFVSLLWLLLCVVINAEVLSGSDDSKSCMTRPEYDIPAIPCDYYETDELNNVSESLKKLDRLSFRVH